MGVGRIVGAGASADEVRHAVLMALTTTGFPRTVAALEWAAEVLEASSYMKPH